MRIRIGEFPFTECWDGVLYKKLSHYPHPSAWELQSLWDFIRYESAHGRDCSLEGEEAILQALRDYESRYDSGPRVPPPAKITECTACPAYGGCMTDLVCHTSPVENAVQILRCGSLLSPVLARGLSPAVLAAEPRNAAHDPEDYFHYVMFAWGNCQAGDRLVVERRLGRAPTEADLAAGFLPGVRFYFRYADLLRHPGATLEGVLPLKVRDGVVLRDWVHAVLVPACYRAEVEPRIPAELRERVHFLSHQGLDLWAWSARAYEYARRL